MFRKIEEADNVDFWRDISKKYKSATDAEKHINMCDDTIRRYMNFYGLKFNEVGSGEKYNLDKIKNAIILHGGVREAAESMGVKPKAIRDKLCNEGTSMTEIMRDYQYRIAPEQKLQEKITGDCVITADHHCPFVSLKWINRVIGIGEKENIKQLLIAGDFFDFDRLSYWLKQSNAEDMAVPLENELNLASMVLEKFEQQYDTIYFIGGNHWLRLLKNITFSIGTKKALGLVGRQNDPRYKINEHFNWILIDDKVRVTHPGKARKADHTLARDLSYIHPEQWMVVAHRHRVNEGFSPSGKPLLEIGWLGDTERMRYIQHTDSTYYQWINGFAYYKNGKIRNLTDYNMDWEEIDNKYNEK